MNITFIKNRFRYVKCTIIGSRNSDYNLMLYFEINAYKCQKIAGLSFQ